MTQVKGDLSVKRSLTVDRRITDGFSAETIVAIRNITVNDYAWLRITNTTTQDIVLPDATTLLNGWKQVIDVPSTSGASVNVKTYHATTPVLLKNILAGRTYTFILVDNSTSIGVWKIEFIEESEFVPVERFVSTFTATTEWGTASGGFYTITVTEATHGRGVQPLVTIQELSGSDYINVSPHSILILANGNISISVPDSPDLRFAGRMIIV